MFARFLCALCCLAVKASWTISSGHERPEGNESAYFETTNISWSPFSHFTFLSGSV